MRTARVLVLLAFAAVVGCSEEPPVPDDTLVVYSLEPWQYGKDEQPEPGEVLFHRYLVIGSTEVADPSRRQEILDAVRRGIEDADPEQDLGELGVGVFRPRHGLHHVAEDGTVTDWLISFSSGQVREIRNGELVRVEKGVGGKTWRDVHRNITHRPYGPLNDTLRTAGVKLAD
jgi:hypothetical protein